MALAHYREAEQSFEARLALLTDLRSQAEDPNWVKNLLLVFSATERDEERMAELVARWRQQLGHTDWLEWLATEDTHQVLMEWRELLAVRDWLTALPQELNAFEQIAVERRRRGAEARALLEDEALLANREALEQEIADRKLALDALSQSGAVRSMDWMGKLATPEERALLDELEGMRALVSTHMDGADRKKWLGRIDRLQGTVFWQIADDRADRTRQLEKTHTENLALLEDVDARITRVANAEAEFAAGVETDFLIFADRADLLTADVANALDARQVALAGELRRGMAREMKEVQQYLLVTRIGIARATDELAMGSETVEGE